jgi:hypothetical protein
MRKLDVAPPNFDQLSEFLAFQRRRNINEYIKWLSIENKQTDLLQIELTMSRLCKTVIHVYV